MNLLLDTHVLIWWATDNPRLEKEGLRTILESIANEVYFSSLSIREIAIKHSRGQLPLGPDLLRNASLQAGLLELPFRSSHAAKISSLPPIHQDPFDRAMIAQALIEPMAFVSIDTKVRQYPGLLFPVG